MPPHSPCPSLEVLRRSIDPDDPMPKSERQHIEAHVDHCDRGCKRALDALLRGNTLLLADSGTPGADPEDEPQVVAVGRSKGGTDSSESRSRRTEAAK